MLWNGTCCLSISYDKLQRKPSRGAMISCDEIKSKEKKRKSNACVNATVVNMSMLASYWSWCAWCNIMRYAWGEGGHTPRQSSQERELHEWRIPNGVHPIERSKGMLHIKKHISASSTTALPKWVVIRSVLGHRHHFTQLPRQEKVNQETRLSDGFYVTIHFITGFNNISRGEARGTCMERLQRMDIALSRYGILKQGRHRSQHHHQELGGLHKTPSLIHMQRRFGTFSWKSRMVTGTLVRSKRLWPHDDDKESTTSPQRQGTP